MARKRILLGHINGYSGHRQASLAIEEALRGLNNEALGNVDFLKKLLPIGHKALEAIYILIIKKWPEMWDEWYDNRKVQFKVKKCIHAFQTWKFPKLIRLIEELEPEVFCGTQAFTTLLMANLKEKYFLNKRFPKIGAVLTDYAPHRYWPNKNIDIYFVPSAEVGDILVERGVPKEKIRVSGIPISLKFQERLTDEAKERVFRRIELFPFMPVVLVMGGGRGLGLIKETVKKLDDIPASFQIVVVCGKNEKLKNELRDLVSRADKRIRVLGYVDNIHELMKISSLIITKAGGITVSECLACGLPMILFNLFPGQERLNARFLAKNNLAKIVSSPAEAANQAAFWIRNPELNIEIRERTKKFAKLDSALVIANTLINN